MAVPVLAAGDRIPRESVLEAAFVGVLHDQAPSERVWDGLAVELGAAGFGHLRLNAGPVTAAVADADLVPLQGSTLGLPGRRLVARVHAAQVAKRRAYAEGLEAVADLSALVESCRPFDDGSASASRVTGGEYLAQVLAFELGISTRAAMDRLGRAWALQRLPRSRAALFAGWLGIGAVNAMVAATAGVDPDRLDEVESRVFDALGARRLSQGSEDLGFWTAQALTDLPRTDPALASDLDAVSTPAWVRARCRTAIKAVDPSALGRQVKASRSRRDVRVWDAAEPGMAWLAMLGTQAEVAACYRRIDAEATQRQRSAEAQEVVDPATGELPTLANSRADVMVDRVLGSGPDGTSGPAINLTVHVVPAEDGGDPGFRGQPTGPADPCSIGRSIPAGDMRVAPLGPVEPQVVGDLIGIARRSGRAAGSGPGRVRIRRVTPTTCPGHEPGADPGPYRPNPDLIAQVVARDVTCRFPGCAVAAQGCDIDHSVPWPLGPTCICNLAALCRRHHRVKTHHRGWHLTNHGDGCLTWTTPTGRTIDTHPARGPTNGPAP